MHLWVRTSVLGGLCAALLACGGSGPVQPQPGEYRVSSTSLEEDSCRSVEPLNELSSGSTVPITITQAQGDELRLQLRYRRGVPGLATATLKQERPGVFAGPVTGNDQTGCHLRELVTCTIDSASADAFSGSVTTVISDDCNREPACEIARTFRAVRQ